MWQYEVTRVLDSVLRHPCWLTTRLGIAPGIEEIDVALRSPALTGALRVCPGSKHQGVADSFLWDYDSNAESMQICSWGEE
jgi:hypothetical protein